MHACHFHVCLLHFSSMCLLHYIMLIMVVSRLPWGTWCHFVECNFRSIWLVTLLYEAYTQLDYIVGLWGIDPGSELFSQTNPYTIGPFGIRQRSMDWSLTLSSMGGCWNQIFAPLRWMWCRFSPIRPTFTQVALRTIPPFNISVICYDRLSRSPN